MKRLLYLNYIGKDGTWNFTLNGLSNRNDWHSHWRCVAFAALPVAADEFDIIAGLEARGFLFMK